LSSFDQNYSREEPFVTDMKSKVIIKESIRAGGADQREIYIGGG